ncbi:MAG: shikimate dehydrogenase, partial [Candidatus Ranarchaeia archaeon]
SWVNTSTLVICLFGDPVEHSLSPIIQNAAFKHLNLNYIYIAHRVDDIRTAIDAARSLGYAGFNVTVPHKISASEAVDVLDKPAKATGAINTGYWKENKLHGTNTDTIGAFNLLTPYKTELQKKNLLVLGAGGGARAIVYALTQLFPSNSIDIANRTIEHIHDLAKNFPQAEIHSHPLSDIASLASKASLIINTTSVGRTSDVSLIPQSAINSSQIIFDINYRRQETRLIKDAKEASCQHINGLDLLVAQGAASFKLWTGSDAPVDIMTQALEDIVL